VVAAATPASAQQDSPSTLPGSPSQAQISGTVAVFPDSRLRAAQRPNPSSLDDAAAPDPPTPASDPNHRSVTPSGSVTTYWKGHLMIRTTGAGRLGALLLLAAPIVYLIGETVAALAWTSPPYDYLDDYVSSLGVAGPLSHAFGQTMNSPLAAVMNTGFILYGILTITAGGLLLRLGSGVRPVILAILIVAFGIGGILLGLVPGSQHSVDSGLIVYHTLGAQLAIISGNTLAILVGAFRRRLHLSRSVAAVTIVLGTIGLVFLVAFLIDVRAGINITIGLLERGAIYPFVATHIILGACLLTRFRRSTRHPVRSSLAST
jgi:hypothetical membrane protein